MRESGKRIHERINQEKKGGPRQGTGFCRGPKIIKGVFSKGFIREGGRLHRVNGILRTKKKHKVCCNRERKKIKGKEGRNREERVLLRVRTWWEGMMGICALELTGRQQIGGRLGGPFTECTPAAKDRVEER
eukprot:TRINITY_DN9890_c0_g1_i1.p1 TRINITY_DN9890_c0_g1~~TRINITY_DN9890_c0_g1_i1.p1  ORF type:complete len:132 (-),score=2.29 TRINITY_DN9890_c0_g1_i1:247-642(-)